MRRAGERSDNLERAIRHYRAALEIYTLNTFPQNYANAQMHLGIAYRDRIAGDRRENLEQAIACQEAALEVYTLDAFPVHYARLQFNLGNTYRERIAEEQADNLERAMDCYQPHYRCIHSTLSLSITQSGTYRPRSC